MDLDGCVCVCVLARVSETIIKEEMAMDLRKGWGTWRELEVEKWGWKMM